MSPSDSDDGPPITISDAGSDVELYLCRESDESSGNTYQPWQPKRGFAVNAVGVQRGRVEGGKKAGDDSKVGRRPRRMPLACESSAMVAVSRGADAPTDRRKTAPVRRLVAVRD